MKAKKSLGQNFLKSALALNKIIEAGEIKPEDVILEIGPGRGALTEKLLEKCNHVIAIEKDRELFEFLKIKFAKEIEQKKLILKNEDILEFNVCGSILEIFSGPRRGVSQTAQKLPEYCHYKIIANIPYNITGAILKKFLTAENQPTLMVLMVQHEVAKRIVASDKKESLLSISVKAYGEPRMIMKVPARYFSPAPKIDSAVIAIKNISRKNFLPLLDINSPHPDPLLEKERGAREEIFWRIVKAGFAHKRKKLSGNLKNVIFCEGSTFVELGNKRAEDLTLTDWLALTKTCIWTTI